ncbi:serine hydrolase domain-containing protein [Sphingomonas flavalba]|uniref:serine hydrolase domain-containing protein n=1 Tax=Sphingomonas flavalba TaxID=2559804 RepID=UPI0039E08CFC
MRANAIDRRLAKALAAAALLLPTAGAAQQLPAPGETPYTRALAAGYKAAFLCSGLFVAGRTQAQVEAEELIGIYPELEPLIPSLPAKVDSAARTVSVAFDDALPPRIAVWRPLLGCATLPIGADAAAARRVPRLTTLGGGPQDNLPWPMGDIGATAPARGDQAALDKAVAAAFDRQSYGADTDTTAVIVLQDGRIVAEHYRDGFGKNIAQRTWSVAKSMAGTLIGHAAQEGLLDPTAPAPIPEWQAPGDPRAAITTDMLLRMASGLHSDSAGNRTDALYFGGTTVTEQAPGWPLEATPMRRFRYANNDIVLAVRGLRATLGDARMLSYPYMLFRRLGMTRTVAETDWQGNFILSSQVWTTARDLARFGLLYAQDGMWQGERVLPAGWTAYVRNPAGPQPAEGAGYGATFWLFGEAQGLPAGSYAAQGNRGQYVMIVPDRNTVVVRLGLENTKARFAIDRFTADILATLTAPDTGE